MDSEDLKELRRRAKGGDVFAMRLLGLRLIDGATPVSSNAEGMLWLISAHNNGDVSASRKLSELYESGIRGVKPNMITSELYIESLVNCSTESYKIGKILFDGKIVRRDVPRALEFFMKASEDGDVRGDRMLSSIYTFGGGVEASEEKAAFWRKEAEKKTQGSKRYRLRKADVKVVLTHVPLCSIAMRTVN